MLSAKVKTSEEEDWYSTTLSRSAVVLQWRVMLLCKPTDDRLNLSQSRHEISEAHHLLFSLTFNVLLALLYNCVSSLAPGTMDSCNFYLTGCARLQINTMEVIDFKCVCVCAHKRHHHVFATQVSIDTLGTPLRTGW